MAISVGGALAIGAIAAPIIGGVIGSMNSASARAAAAAAAQKAVDAINAVGAGPDLARQIYMQKFQEAGILTPELEQAVNAGTSKAAEATGDKQGVDAQKSALQMLQQRSQSGLSPQDMANMNNLHQQIAAEAEGRRQQILQNFAARGQGGSGSELIASLQNAQAGTNQANQGGLNIAAQAQQNALSALVQGANLGGALNQQAFSQNLQKGQAADEFQRFNVSNQIAQQARNVGAQNAAQAANLANKQGIMNANTGQYNQEQLRQRDAEQQMYTNKMNLAIAKSNAYNNQGTNLQNQANSTAQQWASIGQGAGVGAGAIAGAYAQNPKAFGGTADAPGSKITNVYTSGSPSPGSSVGTNTTFATDPSLMGGG